jgi:hypothetical protein
MDRVYFPRNSFLFFGKLSCDFNIGQHNHRLRRRRFQQQQQQQYHHRSQHPFIIRPSVINGHQTIDSDE